MNRRSILAMFGGGAASALSGQSVKDAAASLGVPGSAAIKSQAGNAVSAQIGIAAGYPHRLMSLLHREREKLTYNNPYMPAHIATKKSWSQSFKESVHQQEIREIEALIDRLQSDEELASRVARFLGVDA